MSPQPLPAGPADPIKTEARKARTGSTSSATATETSQPGDRASTATTATATAPAGHDMPRKLKRASSDKSEDAHENGGPDEEVKEEAGHGSPSGGEGDGDDGSPDDGKGSAADRRRKRSRKGLDKKYTCPQDGCGKSYSRAEHLYRHQLNRESSSLSQAPNGSARCHCVLVLILLPGGRRHGAQSEATRIC